MPKLINFSTTLYTLTLITLLSSTTLLAQTTPSLAESLQQNGADQIAVATKNNPEVLWQNYLAENDFFEGINTQDGKTLYLQSSSAVVRGSFDSKWINARNVAFEKAELNAKAQLAETIATDIKSTRSLTMLEGGGAGAPKLGTIVELHKELSLVQKGERLMSAELDAKLRRHYPDWDGTGVSPELAKRKVATLVNALLNEMSSKATQVISGATPMFHAEGYDDRGDYIVLVGIVWSPALADIARSFYDPEFQLTATEPGQPVRQMLTQRLANDSTSLATFNGVRVWRDEKGQRVLISAASHDRGSEDFITSRKNELVARNRMARFIAETVTSNSSSDLGKNSYLEYADGSNEVFDAQTFNSQITAETAQTKLTGVVTVRKWKGTHPISGSPMMTTVMAWTPDSAEKVRQLTQRASTTETIENSQSTRTTVSTPRTLTGPASYIDDF